MSSSPHPGDISENILPSHGITLAVPNHHIDRPLLVQHLSTPTYQSPLRHHRRTPSQHREVKETLNARSEYTNSEDDGRAEHRINQYIIGEEIGRGSFGAVHLAKDQYGNEYAVKEFSKSRLRKRARSNILRRPHDVRRSVTANRGFNPPLHRHSASDVHDSEENGNPLYLIKGEIAIMKKLNHPNLVSLIEVLDDPDEDSLYMVLEMCKKGVVMKVGLDEQADPYPVESCRYWFRDLILGIEYLHAQGVVHRDIKPDNLLLTEDDVLKIVDFGVSEMFEKTSEMTTAKSAGSPAFLPPELCIAKHGDVSGKAADIWSMGVSLYCLRFGRIPFERAGVMELYESIKNDKVDLSRVGDPAFGDLMNRILEKDPKKRITMPELREHPWVTNNGTDPLLPYEENISNLVETPSEKEKNHAITTNMKNLVVVMKAVRKFKGLMWDKRPKLMQNRLGANIKTAAFIDEEGEHTIRKTQSMDLDDRRVVDGTLVTERVHRPITPQMKDSIPVVGRMDSAITMSQNPKSSSPDESQKGHKPYLGGQSSLLTPSEPHSKFSGDSPGARGHAHDPTDERPLFLGIGTGDHDNGSAAASIAESPAAAEESIYDLAYQKEAERIREAQGHKATVYLTRRVDRKKEYQADDNMLELPALEEVKGQAHEGFMKLLEKAKAKKDGLVKDESPEVSGSAAAQEKTVPEAAETAEGKEIIAQDDGAIEAVPSTRKETETTPRSTTTGKMASAVKVPSPLEIKSRGKKLSELVDRAQEELRKKGKEGSGMVSELMQKVSAIGRKGSGTGPGSD